MMDTIENRPLTEPATQEAGEVATVTEVTVTPILSKEDVISRLQEICESESPIDKSELDNLKQSFYRLRNAEVEAARKAHAENGGSDENFITPKDDLETNFREIMNTIKEKRNALKAEEEREKQENLEKKLSIIDRIKELAESTEEAKNAYSEIKEKEQRNLDEKTVICEIVESMEYDKMITFQDWHDKTEEILALQAKWKTIGFAPQKMNTKIFERFRNACDDFFKRKAEHFKALKGNMNENLERKKQMCEKAEALKDSTDWKATAEILTKLQKEWKETGPVAKKYSEAIWKRFVSACDYFFEQKSKAENANRNKEHENLDKKKAIIDKLNAINTEETSAENARNVIRELMAEWNSIGHVPFKDKDKIYKQYHSIVDSLFDKLNQSASKKKLNQFKSGLHKETNPQRERERLVRIYENMKNEIKTYENNIGFLTSSSKKGNSLVTELNRKIEKLKNDLELISQKIAIIDEAAK